MIDFRSKIILHISYTVWSMKADVVEFVDTTDLRKLSASVETSGANRKHDATVSDARALPSPGHPETTTLDRYPTEAVIRRSAKLALIGSTTPRPKSLRLLQVGGVEPWSYPCFVDGYGFGRAG